MVPAAKVMLTEPPTKLGPKLSRKNTKNSKNPLEIPLKTAFSIGINGDQRGSLAPHAYTYTYTYAYTYTYTYRHTYIYTHNSSSMYIYIYT